MEHLVIPEANLGFSLQNSVDIHSIMEIPRSGEAAQMGKLVIPRAFGSNFVRSGAKGFPPKVGQNLFHYGNPLEWRSCPSGAQENLARPGIRFCCRLRGLRKRSFPLEPAFTTKNVPYTETHYAPADISDTSGDTKYRHSLTTPTRFQPYASTRQEPRMWARSPMRLANIEAWILAASAPPLFRGMWAAPRRLTEKLEFGDGETRRGTQEVGGPFSASRHTTSHERHGSESSSSSILPFPPRSLTSPPERNDNAKPR
jgi:hypothetical protein